MRDEWILAENIEGIRWNIGAGDGKSRNKGQMATFEETGNSKFLPRKQCSHVCLPEALMDGHWNIDHRTLNLDYNYYIRDCINITSKALHIQLIADCVFESCNFSY